MLLTRVDVWRRRPQAVRPMSPVSQICRIRRLYCDDGSQSRAKAVAGAVPEGVATLEGR